VLAGCPTEVMILRLCGSRLRFPYHQRIKVKLTVSGSDVHLDFSGTDPQCAPPSTCRALAAPTNGSYWNCQLPPHVRPRSAAQSWHFAIGDGRYSRRQPVEPKPGRATGVRHVTGYRVSDAVLGALSQAVRTEFRPPAPVRWRSFCSRILIRRPATTKSASCNRCKEDAAVGPPRTASTE